MPLSADFSRASTSLPPKKSVAVLDRLLQENEELRARQTHLESRRAKDTTTPWHPTSISNDEGETSGTQILEQSDWFTHTKTSDTPIWIGEISDAAFATRFRQFACCSQTPSHIPRTQFASDDTISALAISTPAGPSPARAKLLVETALQFLRHSYHIVRRSEVLSMLNTGYLDQSNPSARAKMWALFAIGELRLGRCLSSSNELPGLAYFAVASDAMRMLNERPQLDVIETILLLILSALYSLEANRRHSACTFMGSALRLSTVMGLHVNIGDAYIPDPKIREHRIRVWWSVYILDRVLSAKTGLPLLISDDDISVDLPSRNSDLNSEDFGNEKHLVTVVRLAKIAGNISRSLYVRTPQRGTFLQRVEKIREELSSWKEQLPDYVKHDFDQAGEGDEYPQPVNLTLQLSFNQLFILATRPVLLFVFRQHVGEVITTSTDRALPDHARDIADACIRSARQSCRLLSQSWINGDFGIFDYSYVQYLFSAAIILAIAGTLGRETSQGDIDEFNLAAGFLQQLEKNGNLAAMEFCSHIEETKLTLEALRSANYPQRRLSTSNNVGPQPSESLHSSFIDQSSSIAGSNEIRHVLHNADGSPLSLSFLDDWIYDNALQQLCWQEQ
ncbi:fungal-specific transcription factor domain-containing protein [Mariannaea sp. PMI_226]|nr:fungal-specific transcription factor domain-containing protein [Mariannaea sp. PMI_226]